MEIAQQNGKMEIVRLSVISSVGVFSSDGDLRHFAKTGKFGIENKVGMFTFSYVFLNPTLFPCLSLILDMPLTCGLICTWRANGFCFVASDSGRAVLVASNLSDRAEIRR